MSNQSWVTVETGAARRVAAALGRLGAAPTNIHFLGAAPAQAAARRLEASGYSVLWIPESVAGKELFSQAGLLLAGSKQIIIGSAIANIYARDANAAASGARVLGEGYPNRFVLGLGVSHESQLARRGHHYERPIEHMTRYLDALAVAPFDGPLPRRAVPVVLAALGPRMLALARARTLGAISTFVPVEHTSRARRILGPDRFLAVKITAVVVDTKAAGIAVVRDYERRHHLTYANYLNNLRRLGWSEQELANGGSVRLLQAVSAVGSIEDVRDRVLEHLGAGADHVAVYFLGEDRRDPCIEHYESLGAITESLI